MTIPNDYVTGILGGFPFGEGALRNHFRSDDYSDGLDMNTAETQYKLEVRSSTTALFTEKIGADAKDVVFIIVASSR